jgi:YVTN family beta-propeller protein
MNLLCLLLCLANLPHPVAPPQNRPLRLVKTITGPLSPKSVVHSGSGLFFAQNMMYRHTIRVYDRQFRLVKSLSDTINPAKFGYPQYNGQYQGAPVEVAFADGGATAWVSNYQMYGRGFNNPGNDRCGGGGGHDRSFVYAIDTKSLEIVRAVLVGSVPKYVAVTPDSRLVLVSNWCSYDLSVVDAKAGREVRRVRLGAYPRGIVVTPDSGTAYVAVMGSRDIAVVDLKTYAVRWFRGVGSSPRHLCLDPGGRFLYATLNGEGTVIKIALPSGRVLNRVATGRAPRSMVLSADGGTLYVVNNLADTMTKLRAADMKPLQTVRTNHHPIGITYDAQTRQVWVACYTGSLMVFQD